MRTAIASSDLSADGLARAAGFPSPEPIQLFEVRGQYLMLEEADKLAVALGLKAVCDAKGPESEPGDIDCMVAMVAGLMEAQMSNDPGGHRWTRHLNRLVDLYVDDAIERKGSR